MMRAPGIPHIQAQGRVGPADADDAMLRMPPDAQVSGRGGPADAHDGRSAPKFKAGWRQAVARLMLELRLHRLGAVMRLPLALELDNHLLIVTIMCTSRNFALKC